MHYPKSTGFLIYETGTWLVPVINKKTDKKIVSTYPPLMQAFNNGNVITFTKKENRSRRYYYKRSRERRGSVPIPYF